MPVIVPPAPSFPGVAQINGCTTVKTVTELFPATGSVPVVVTAATFVIVAAVLGVVPVTVIVIGVARGYATVPRLQVMVLGGPVDGAPQLPWLVVAEAPMSWLGSVSVKVTAAPAASPKFVI